VDLEAVRAKGMGVGSVFAPLINPFCRPAPVCRRDWHPHRRPTALPALLDPNNVGPGV